MVYRGHREPVWDVQWGPKGIYFASGSRDRTARIWISDKVAAVRIFVGHLSDVNVRLAPSYPLFSPRRSLDLINRNLTISDFAVRSIPPEFVIPRDRIER